MKNLLFVLIATTLYTISPIPSKAQSCDCNTSIVGSTIFGTGAGVNAPTGDHEAQITAIGSDAGANSIGYRNTFVGGATAWRMTSGDYNTALGAFALAGNETGSYNTTLGGFAGGQIKANHNIAIGYGALSNQTGSTAFNAAEGVIAIGNEVGKAASSGGYGVIMIGHEAGVHYAGGDRSTIIGNSAGRGIGGNDVVAIGNYAGATNVGDGCIYIGSGMTTGVWGSPSNYTNHLFIGNSTNKEFLVGDIASGKLGINTNTPQNALDVCGKIRSDEVIIENNWCDYVFYKNYQLPSLKEEAQHIEEKGHLIGFQSEEEMNGEIHLSDVTKRQQVKIEEVMLHLIKMEKRLNTLTEENAQLKQEIKELQRN